MNGNDRSERHPGAAQDAAAAGRPGELIRSAVVFVALSYAISWALWIPAVRIYLADPRITPLGLGLVLVGAYGPTIAAFLLTARSGGTPAVRALGARYLQFRAGVLWPILALGIPAAVFLIGIGFNVLAGAERPTPVWSALTLGSFLGRVAFALPFGPLAEEAGWRGYLLPLLQRRWSALTSSLVIGVIWTLWHIPMFWVPGAALPPEVAPSVGSVGIYLLGVSATSIIATFLYNSSAGSLGVAVLYHLGTNLWHQVLAPVFVGEATAAWRDLRLPALAANGLVALAIVALFGARRLSRRDVVV